MTGTEVDTLLAKADGDAGFLARLIAAPREAAGELGVTLTDDEVATFRTMSADDVRSFAAEYRAATDPEKRRAACLGRDVTGVLGVDVGNAKIKLCWGEAGSPPRLLTRPLPYDDRRAYDRFGDVERGCLEALRELLGEGANRATPSVAVVVTSAGYAYPSYREGVAHVAATLSALLPGTRVSMLSATLEPVPASEAARGDAAVNGPIAFSNPNGGAWLARRLGALGPEGRGLSLDTGGQTTGTVVLDGARVDPAALADPARHVEHRVANGKLAWVGVETTPLEYLAGELTVAGRRRLVIPRGVTFWNVSALLGLLPPERASKLSLFGLLPTRARALRAIADAVNLDLELADEAELVAIARAFHALAIEKLAGELTRALATLRPGGPARAVVFGLGARALARPALELAGVAESHVVLADERIAPEHAEAASCFGAWHLAAELDAGCALPVLGAR